MDDAIRRRLENFESAHKAAEDVDTNKISAYTAGFSKKSKREKEQEAAEAKRLKEEEDAAKAYKDFVASFEGPDDGPSHSSSGPSRPFKPFVKAGGSGSAPSGGFRSLSGPSNANPLAGAPSGPRGFSNNVPSGPRANLNDKSHARSTNQAAMSPASVFREDEPAPTKAPPQGRKRRAMDSFLEELKRDQADREHRLQSRVQQGVATSVSAAAAEDMGRSYASGSYDTGDSGTTNIHVSNLPANVTTNAIGMYFAQYGSVASVKIMWPRESLIGGATPALTRPGLSGFVAFMKRADAERAMEKCDGAEWEGTVMRLGWGKSMPLPPRPAYVSSANTRSNRSRSPSPKRARQRSISPPGRRRRSDSYEDRGRSGRRGSSPGRHPSRSRSRGRRRSDSYSRSRSRSRSRGRYRDRSRSRSYSPERARRWPKLEDDEQKRLLEDIASRFKRYGKKFENTLRTKEFNNPKYDFLREESLPAYHYFKMLLDPRYRGPSPPPPAYEDEGDMDVISSDDSAYEDEMAKNRRGALGRLPRLKLETMLRTIVNTRDKIARIMCFALDRPDAAEEVVDVMIQSLLIPATPVPRKVARLNAISDILHNCAGTATSSWKYRSLFESRLPAVFSHLGNIYKSFPGRMKAEQFRQQIMATIRVWEDWLVFTPTVTADFQKRLSSGDEDVEDQTQDDTQATRDASATETATEKAKAPGFRKIGFAAVKVGDTSNNADVAMANAEEEDLDGEVIVPAQPAADENIDGESIDGEDIDGAPL